MDGHRLIKRSTPETIWRKRIVGGQINDISGGSDSGRAVHVNAIIDIDEQAQKKEGGCHLRIAYYGRGRPVKDISCAGVVVLKYP